MGNTSGALDRAPSVKELFSFYLPLAIVCVANMATYSLISVGLARLAKPEVAIAAYAVAKSFLFIILAPTTVFSQIGVSLCDRQVNYTRTRNFLLGTIGLIMLLLAALRVTGISYWWFSGVNGLTEETARFADVILIVFIVFPLAMGCRNFIHGVFSRLRFTLFISIISAVKIIYVVIMVGVIGRIERLSAPVLAGGLLVSAIGLETVVAWAVSRMIKGPLGPALERTRRDEDEELSYRDIFKFSMPLYFTAFFGCVTTPILNLVMARTGDAEYALSGFEVGWGLGMIVMALIFLCHQTVIVFYRRGGDNRALTRFYLWTSAGVAALMLLLGYTPLGPWILRGPMGMEERIVWMALGVVRLIILLVPIRMVHEYIWGMLMLTRRTPRVSTGKLINIVSIVLLAFSFAWIPFQNPSLIGPLAIIGGELIELIWLLYMERRDKMRVLGA